MKLTRPAVVVIILQIAAVTYSKPRPNYQMESSTQSGIKSKAKSQGRSHIRRLSPKDAARLAAWTPDDIEPIWQISGQFEGDIILTDEQRNGAIGVNPWPKRKEKPGCSSRVGYVGGLQKINLSNNCLRNGTIVHEFLHAAGFWHQQSASERDDYIIIVWDNIMDGKEHNFQKHDTNNYGQIYDYGSIMHYSDSAFAVNANKPTIIPKVNATIGQRKGMSKIDLIKLNKMYKCPKPSQS